MLPVSLCRGEHPTGRDEEALAGRRGLVERQLESGPLSMDSYRTNFPRGEQRKREEKQQNKGHVKPCQKPSKQDTVTGQGSDLKELNAQGMLVTGN